MRTELAPFPATLATVKQAQLDQLAARYLEMLARTFPNGERVTDKRPDNFLYIGLIKRLFPDARIVHTVRNPQYRRLMAHWKALYGADILDLDYDALVCEPRPAIERLTAFCGLEWEEACLAFEQSKRAVKTASVRQVRERLYHRSSGRWLNYAKQLAPLQASGAGTHRQP